MKYLWLFGFVVSAAVAILMVITLAIYIFGGSIIGPQSVTVGVVLVLSLWSTGLCWARFTRK